jgi:hypothetical protein
MEKIGMCCMCGGSFAKSQTIVCDGQEYCKHCADLMGMDPDDDEKEQVLTNE